VGKRKDSLSHYNFLCEIYWCWFNSDYHNTTMNKGVIDAPPKKKTSRPKASYLTLATLCKNSQRLSCGGKGRLIPNECAEDGECNDLRCQYHKYNPALKKRSGKVTRAVAQVTCEACNVRLCLHCWTPFHTNLHSMDKACSEDEDA